MKRKILAWCAAIVIVALVSAAFLRPADQNPDFGMVAELYYLNGVVEPITDCTGDTHILTAVSTEWNDYRMDDLVVRFSGDSDKRYAYNAGWYVDGELMPSDDPDTPKGGIEKLVDGEWVWHSGIAVSKAFIHTMIPPPFDTIAAGETLSFKFPHNEPGTYRITYTLREAIVYRPGVVGSGLPRYATGEEVYVISHTYTVPEPSGKHFDLLGVAADVFTSRADSWLANVHMLIRNNDGFHFYQDLSCGKLEKKIDGAWVDVSTAQEGLLEMPHDDTIDEGGRGILADISTNEFYRTFYIDDPEATYRLTLEFVENEDGSGERYTLQFCMNFSEEE